MLTSPIPSFGDLRTSGDVEMNLEVGVRETARETIRVERSIVMCCTLSVLMNRLKRVKREVM